MILSLSACMRPKSCIEKNTLFTFTFTFTCVTRRRQHPGIKTTINPAEDNRRKQCKPNETQRHSNTCDTLQHVMHGFTAVYSIQYTV